MTRPSSFCGRLSRNLLIVTFALSVLGLQVPARTDPSIPAAEFSRLIQQFSEDDGYFRSDNFTSNETSYLQVVDLFRKLDVSGGAYIGVGPEQNFTYIAKVRPRIAFIVDIRRQAMIQHLLYKAIFESAATRAEFLAGLLSRPIAGERAPRAGTSTADLLDYFEQAARHRTKPSSQTGTASGRRSRTASRSPFPSRIWSAWTTSTRPSGNKESKSRFASAERTGRAPQAFRR